MTRSPRLSVGQLVCWLVCHNFLKGRKASLPCSYRSTCNYYYLETIMHFYVPTISISLLVKRSMKGCHKATSVTVDDRAVMSSRKAVVAVASWRRESFLTWGLAVNSPSAPIILSLFEEWLLKIFISYWTIRPFQQPKKCLIASLPTGWIRWKGIHTQTCIMNLPCQKKSCFTLLRISTHLLSSASVVTIAILSVSKGSW